MEASASMSGGKRRWLGAAAVALILCGILLVFAVAGWVYALRLRSVNESTVALLDERTDQVVALSGRVDALEGGLETQGQELTACNTDLEVAKKRVSDADQDNANLRGQLSEARMTTRERANQVSACEDRLQCRDQGVEIDYTSNATVSESLKAYLEETRGSIYRAEWDVIWNDSSTAIHRLHGKYLYIYLVSFDEPENYRRAYVYDINKECFLDRGSLDSD